MSSLPKVALAGATGNLGPAILNALLEANLAVTILTRHGSKSTDSLPAHHNQTIKAVDYTSVDSLTAALTGIDVVVSTLGGESAEQTKPLIDAAIAAGVSRFIPSEFGSDIVNPRAATLPVFAPKLEILAYLKQQTAAHPSFSYTVIRNNAFFDWGLQVKFLVNASDHTATLYDGGDRPSSVTRLSTVGHAVAAVIARNLDATRNEELYIHDAAVTQKQLIEIVRKADGREWETSVASTAEIEKDGLEKLRKGQTEDMMGIMIGFLMRAIWAEGYGGDFSGRVANELLGLPVLSPEEVEVVVREILDI